MPVPNPNFVASVPLQYVFRDKDTGLPLSAGVVRFYSDPDFNIPKDVYQISNLSGNDVTFVNIGSVLILSSIGTFVDDSGENLVPYYWPWDSDPGDTGLVNPGDPELYFITVDSSGGVRQFTLTYWPPDSLSGSSSSNSQSALTDNQITNPQFSQVLFEPLSTLTLAVSGTNSLYDIAPGWQLRTSGAGTITVTHNAMSSDIVTEAPYSITINGDTGVNIDLLQRIEFNPRLLGNPSDGVTPTAFINGGFAAASNSAVALQMYYQQSGASDITSLGQLTTVATGSWQYAEESSAITLPYSSESATIGYIDVYITIEPDSIVTISSVQLVQVGTDSAHPDYIQESIPLQTSNLYWYDKPNLFFKPIPSLLVGWDFPLNPTQFGSSGNSLPTAAYIWDQTISAAGTSVAYARGSVTSGLQFTTGDTNNAFYILQYLDGGQAKKILGTTLSVNVNAYRGSAGGAVITRIYLYRGSSAATIPTLGSTIGTLATDGQFTLTAANWSLINRGAQGTLGVPSFSLSTVTTNDDINGADNDYGYSGWEITDVTQITDTDKFAIVVSFGYVASGTVITVNSISTVPGDIPTRPAPLSYANTLASCQYYYQKSFNQGITPAQNVALGSGETYGVQVIAALSQQPSSIQYVFNPPLRVKPTGLITLYTPGAGTSGQVTNVSIGVVCTLSALNTNYSTRAFSLVSTMAVASSVGQILAVNWTADARLGII